MTDGFSRRFIEETRDLLGLVSTDDIDAIVDVLLRVRARGGRLFLCGSGGGAGHASHATCDFRKLAGIEAYSVTDNVSELTARINDDDWDGSYAEWLRASRLSSKDCVFVFSVGGGDETRGVSVNLVRAMQMARELGASVVGIAGRDGGFLRRVADASVVVPPGDPANVTAQTEGIQAVVWHLLVTHPDLLTSAPKWESLKA